MAKKVDSGNGSDCDDKQTIPLSTRRIVTIVVNLQDWPGQNHDETGISRH